MILEPMMGGGGCIPAEPEFLAVLREETERQGALLIFDEVMTSRLAPGGMHELTDVTPDLVALGKYLGGGVSFGAFGGRRDLMARLDPRDPNSFTHSGTFNNNVLTMAAGLAGLEKVLTPEATVRLNASGDRLRARLQEAADRRGVALRAMGLGSMICVHFQSGEIRRPADTEAAPPAARKLFQLEMNLEGFYLSRRGFMSLSLPLTSEDHDDLAAAFEEFLDEHAPRPAGALNASGKRPHFSVFATKLSTAATVSGEVQSRATAAPVASSFARMRSRTGSRNCCFVIANTSGRTRASLRATSSASDSRASGGARASTRPASSAARGAGSVHCRSASADARGSRRSAGFPAQRREREPRRRAPAPRSPPARRPPSSAGRRSRRGCSRRRLRAR